MWRWLTVFLLGAVLGAAFGVALGFFLFPFVFPPPEAKDQLTRAEAGKLVAKGEFIHANPIDPIHYGKGGVSVYENVVFLNEYFEVGPGPAFHVYLVPGEKVRDAGQVSGTMFVDLGQLGQSDQIPAGVDLAKFPSVVIWCQQFSVLISSADLTFESSS